MESFCPNVQHILSFLRYTRILPPHSVNETSNQRKNRKPVHIVIFNCFFFSLEWGSFIIPNFSKVNQASSCRPLITATEIGWFALDLFFSTRLFLLINNEMTRICQGILYNDFVIPENLRVIIFITPQNLRVIIFMTPENLSYSFHNTRELMSYNFHNTTELTSYNFHDTRELEL